jgi:hypothetical protein
MAGKPCVLASRPLAFALDALSKNALIDILVDVARASVGAEAPDAAIIEWLQPVLDTVAFHRSDPRVNLQAKLDRLKRHNRLYDNLTMSERYPELKGKNDGTRQRTL